MKKFGSIMDVTFERNAELLAAYRREVAGVSMVVRPDVLARVAASPASRFWVSVERAAVVIRTIEAGRRLPPMRPNRLEMFREIHRRFVRLRDTSPHMSARDILSEVILSPAPCFYLTPRTVGEIIYRIKNGWYDSPRLPKVYS